ncbi:MAG: 30S ribosomal protein S5 [Alphaproteobacteria bacterium]|jgi:small subunit ribosomal protein S5|nr:30S ribosomal protein S5 [Alphaproteobacteria bacterium]MBT5389690.1 30S ribosomal protein S5 [Alphaproteobacteria bacterium]MBT5654112.1 30S ribosomal protein S5 [Alphaproteobacteria bacterium]
MARNAGKERKQGSDLIEKLVDVRRVSKVTKGGRNFGFSALVVVGDGRGRIGHGHGKALEVPEAVTKATEKAKKQMIRVPLRDGRTLHHDSKGKYGAGLVILRSAPSGTGIIAGGPMRAIFEALGIHDVVGKSIRSSNPHNMVRATFEALKHVASPRQIATRRNKKVSEIVFHREGKNKNVQAEDVPSNDEKSAPKAKTSETKAEDKD